MIKSIFFTVLLLISSLGYSYQCEDFASDSNKIETLNFIAQKLYHYPNGAAEFCEKDAHIDLELYFIPNYFRLHEENDDHYKLMVHYSYQSCTFIYNITKKSLSEKSCYSTW